MIVKWLDFSDLHFEYTNVDTVNIRDNLLSTISDKELDADFILMCGDFFYQGKTDESRIKACGDYIHKIICKLCLNGMPVPLLRNCYSIFNGTKYR